MTNDADYLTRPESCRKAADKSTLLPFSWPQYQQLEGMSRPSIRVECDVLNILSVNSTVYYFHKTHRDSNCSYKSLTDPVKPETRL